MPANNALGFKRFDIFKKMPRDLTEPTIFGALVSIICTVVLVGLTIFEIQNYIRSESHAELVIDTSHRDDFVNINLDIVFEKMPCDVLSLDVQDIMGTHKSDIMGDLKKHRIDKNGKVLSTESALEKSEWRASVRDRVKKELDEG
jgi:hypothetical protein